MLLHVCNVLIAKLALVAWFKGGLMYYLSLSFALLVIVAILIYYIVPKKYRWYVLLVTSLIFYVSISIKYSVFIAISILLSYLSALLIPKCNKKAKKVITTCVILALVSVLAFLKFYDYNASLMNIVLQKFQLAYEFPLFDLILPIGISFYTLQIIAYVVDIYRGKMKPQRNLLKYALFISYFPNIIEGPIHRYEQLMDQLICGHAFHYDKIVSSLQLVLWGLLKKMVVADSLAYYVDNVFYNSAGLYGIPLYLAAIAYTIQLYMDFSGCVDICRGISGAFGITLIQNFKQPYFSASIKEFWGRWHISLSSWLKDYIYIPLGGNRKGKGRKYGNLLIVFFISGLWHGRGVVFIIWGLLHALYQIVGEITSPSREKIKAFIGIKKGSASDSFYKILITFHLVAFAWIFFRAESLNTALVFIQHMFMEFNPWLLFDNSLFDLGLSMERARVVLPLVIFIFGIEFVQFKYGLHIREKINELHKPLMWILYITLIMIIVIYGVYGPGYTASDFIYGGF